MISQGGLTELNFFLQNNLHIVLFCMHLVEITLKSMGKYRAHKFRLSPYLKKWKNFFLIPQWVRYLIRDFKNGKKTGCYGANFDAIITITIKICKKLSNPAWCKYVRGRGNIKLPVSVVVDPFQR